MVLFTIKCGSLLYVVFGCVAGENAHAEGAMHNVCSPAQTGEAADYKLQVYARFPKGDQPKCPIKTIASHPPTRTQPQRGEARK